MVVEITTALQNKRNKMDSIELFSGTGGLALGLQLSGFNHKALLEWDHDSCENVKANIDEGYALVRDWSVFETDVRKVKYNDFGQNIKLIAGGPPCQPFSLGGKHQAYNDKRDMFPEAVRAVRELRPLVFVFENVKGLLRNSFSDYFNYIIMQLTFPDIVKQDNMDWVDHMKVLAGRNSIKSKEGLSYNVVFRLLNAADYGVPQVRQRVFIVGFRNDLETRWSVPEPTHSLDLLRYAQFVSGSYWEEHGISAMKRSTVTLTDKESIRRRVELNVTGERWRTVRDALQGLPDPRAESSTFGVYNHEFRAGARTYIGHSGSIMDAPSKTIKAGAHGVPGGENMLVQDNGDLRYYTVRESARIQTFPDEYRFHGSWTESMRQIGNAVPVRLAKIVGDSIKKQLERIDSNL